LVENAFKHGISKTIHNAYLYINIDITEGLSVRVVNNKFNFQRNDSGGGIGLYNLKKRLELLYPGNHLLEIVDGAIQFEVILKINLSC